MIARGRVGATPGYSRYPQQFSRSCRPVRCLTCPPAGAYDQAIRFLGRFLSWTATIPDKDIDKKQRGIMQIRRVLTFCVALAWVGTARADAPRAEQPEQPARAGTSAAGRNSRTSKRSSSWSMVSAQGQPAPTDIPITWESNHFVRGADGTTYVPFTLALDRSKLARPRRGPVCPRRQQGRRAGPAPAANDNATATRTRIRTRARIRGTTCTSSRCRPTARSSAPSRSSPATTRSFWRSKERTPQQQPRNAPPLQSRFAAPRHHAPGLREARTADEQRDHRDLDRTGHHAADACAAAGTAVQLRRDARRAVGRHEAQEERRAPGAVLGLRRGSEGRQAGHHDRVQLPPEDRRRGEVLQQDGAAGSERPDAAAAVRRRRRPPASGQPRRSARQLPGGRLTGSRSRSPTRFRARR